MIWAALLAPGVLVILKVWRDTVAYNRACRGERENFQAAIHDYERRP